MVGYPEICHPEEVNPRFPSPSHGYSAYGNANGTDSSPEEKHYNSAVIISPSGEILAHYRKSFLYYTDETWAYEGGGFFAGRLPIPSPNNRNQSIDTAMGICMDINNYKFTAPWDAYEFANHVKDSNSKLVVMSNAWLRHDQTVTVKEEEKGQPDMLELSYWVERLRPVWEAETAGSTSGAGAANKIIIVIANRTGIERGATYAGTSTVMSMGGDDDGKVRLWGVLGKGQERCLIVDTDEVSSSPLNLKPLCFSEKVMLTFCSHRSMCFRLRSARNVMKKTRTSDDEWRSNQRSLSGCNMLIVPRQSLGFWV